MFPLCFSKGDPIGLIAQVRYQRSTRAVEMMAPKCGSEMVHLPVCRAAWPKAFHPDLAGGRWDQGELVQTQPQCLMEANMLVAILWKWHGDNARAKAGCLEGCPSDCDCGWEIYGNSAKFDIRIVYTRNQITLDSQNQ